MSPPNRSVGLSWNPEHAIRTQDAGRGTGNTYSVLTLPSREITTLRLALPFEIV
jgi:hypothetical protein